MTTLYRILSSGSHGNAIIYNDEILVDFGISYIKAEPYLDKIKYLLITHEHKDHLNITSIVRMAVEYPKIKIIGAAATTDIVEASGLTNTKTIYPGEVNTFGGYEIESFNLKHEVPTVGYKITIKDWSAYYADGAKYHSRDFKIFHATDTGSLSHIKAEGFDLYAVEFNHYAELVQAAIDRKIEDARIKNKRPYIYEYRARRDHMEISETINWLSRNDTKGAIVLMLHVSSKYGDDIDRNQETVYEIER